VKTPAYQWDADNPEGYANAMGRYKSAVELAFVREHLRGERLRILDIGGGSGRFALPLADDGHHVTVVDVSQVALNLLRRRNHPNIVACRGDFYALDIPCRFDAVIAIESVQYFTKVSLIDLFAKVRDLLSANDVPFIFTELNRKSWRYQLRALRGSDKPSYNLTDPAGYDAALRCAGFVIAEMRGFLWMPFSTNSDSPLVQAFAALERGLRLGRWTRQSPWLLVAARSR
jgi:SAM-dependent methyltransferase